MTDGDARSRAALVAARASYGRLLASLAWQWRDIAAAEDALAEAFAAALQAWPAQGVPDSPEGWLMTAARRTLLKAARRRRLERDPAVTVLLEGEDAVPDVPAIPDDRLRLMFVCAHPAIEPSMRCALMLQTVLGLDAARIGQAFLVSPQAMTQRLVRTKAKIKAAGIRFESPQADELAPRVRSVLEAIYGAYVLDGSVGPDGARPADLADEAIHLAELVAAFLPDCAEAFGLLALLTLCEARRPARLDTQGRFVPLDRQDPSRWDRAVIDRADALLARAASLRDPGPLQLEAAIQSAHCHRVRGGATPWADIVSLYEALLAGAPTLGARLGHAIAVAQARDDPLAGLRLLDAIGADGPRPLDGHQSWWAARAHLAAGAGDTAVAIDAYARARALSADVAVRQHLEDCERALRDRPGSPAGRR